MSEETADGPSAQVLTVLLARNPGGADFFFTDVCRLVERVAAVAGLPLGSPTTGPVASGDAPSISYSVAALPDALVRELGRHRAQYVPPDQKDGRVATAEVHVQAGSCDTPETFVGGVLKTYNYVLGQATRHATGETGALEAALTGRL